jgi:hypothetical protein
MSAVPKDGVFQFGLIPAALKQAKMKEELVNRAELLVSYVLEHQADLNYYPQSGRTHGICSYCDYAAICDGIEPMEKYSSEVKIITPVGDDKR